MQQDLLNALQRQYGDVQTPMMRQHLEFATSSRQRAINILDEVQDQTGLQLQGKKLLDVGCAYAGFVIEAAARGASAWGVEVSRKFWEYGKLNARGEPGDINLLPGNFLSPQMADALPHDFDFVLVNDVFEHVYDTAGLLEQLQRVMADGASFLFSIPNGDAVASVESEGHYGKAGITQLPANWWHGVLGTFTAFYRPWTYYAGLFRAFGFHDIQVWNRDALLTVDEARARVSTGLERAAAAVAELEYLDAKTKPVMASAFDDYCARVRADLERGDAQLLQWRYLTEFWRGVAIKRGASLADVDRSPKLAPARATDIAARESMPAVVPADHVVAAPTEFARIPMALSAADLVSSRTVRAAANITMLPDGAIRCDVIGSEQQSEGGQYAGLCIPLLSPGRIRLDLQFEQPENVEAVYLDGEDIRRCRVLRWQWRCRTHKPSTEREVFVLDPGRDTNRFEATDQAIPKLVTHLHIYLRVLPGRRTSFILHRAEVSR